MRRRLAQPYPLSLSFVAPHTVMRGLGLSRVTFGVGRGVACMMLQRLSRSYPHPLYSLPAHAVESWCVLSFFILRLQRVAEARCMMPRCLAQPCPPSVTLG